MFRSNAGNLVSADTERSQDVFLHDLIDGSTVRISEVDGVGGDSGSDRAYIDGAGSRTVFASNATNLVPTDTNGVSDIFLWERTTGAIRRLSVSASGAEADGASEDPMISQDRQTVVFSSEATNLVDSDANGVRDVFALDLGTGAVELVSVDSTGAQSDQRSGMARVSGDGRYVVFTNSGRLGPMATGFVDVVLRDRLMGTTEVLSHAGEPANNVSLWPRITPDARFVVFQSSASNLVAGDNNDATDVFVYARETGSLQVVSLTPSGETGNANSAVPAISDDGAVIVFQSEASDLIEGDDNGATDVFAVRNPE